MTQPTSGKEGDISMENVTYEDGAPSRLWYDPNPTDASSKIDIKGCRAASETSAEKLGDLDKALELSSASRKTENAPAAELPIAWQVYNPLVKDWTRVTNSQHVKKTWDDEGYQSRPLYTRPSDNGERVRAAVGLARLWQEARQYRNWDSIHSRDYKRIVNEGDRLATQLMGESDEK